MSLIKRIKWWSEFAVYRAAEFLLHRLSIPCVHALGSALGRFAHGFLPARRQIVLRNLRIAYGDRHSLDELRQLTREVFARTGANLFCALRTPGISSGELEEILEIRNLDLLLDLVVRGKGVILLSPHMGNWELLAQLIHWFPEGAALGSHYRPLNNPYVNALVERQRTVRGTRLFAKRDSPHTMAAYLRGGGTLGILADQRAGDVGFCCSYYGRFTSCSPLPELLARRTGAAVVSIALESLTPGKWRCTFLHVPEPSTPACMASMEAATRTSPADVFWLQERWKVGRRAPFTLPGRPYKGADPAGDGKPVRLLVWLDSADTPLPALPDERRANLHVEVVCPEGRTPPDFPDLPWSRVWPIDPSLQPEQFARLLHTIDEADILPVDRIVMPRAIPEVQRAADRTGLLHCVVV